MGKVRAAVVAMLVTLGILVAPSPAHAAGVCGLGPAGSYLVTYFYYSAACGVGPGNNAANAVDVSNFPIHTVLMVCTWGTRPANWVVVGVPTYVSQCGFGQNAVGPQAQIVRVR